MIKILRQNYHKNTRLFNKIKQQLIGVLDDCININHVGSTAIPNMSGKNIIDILIDVPTKKMLKKITKKIKNEGYFIGKNNSSADYIFFASRKDETKNGDIHLHLVINGTSSCNDFLILKKYFLDNPIEANNYLKIKYKIAKETNNDRVKYRALKSEYINGLLKCVRSKYYGKITK